MLQLSPNTKKKNRKINSTRNPISRSTATKIRTKSNNLS